MVTTKSRYTPAQKALLDWMERRELTTQREAAKALGIHYMVLNQYLQIGSRRRTPGLATALLIQERAGIPVCIWKETRVSATKRRKQSNAASDSKQAVYGHAR